MRRRSLLAAAAAPPGDLSRARGRTQVVRWTTILVGLFALFAAGAIAVPARQNLYSDARAGLSVRLPVGWHVVHRRLTPCTDPVERLTVQGRGAMVMLQERLAGDAGFAARPDRFVLRGKPSPIECCAPLGRPGWFFHFRDGGRGFYGYVYLGRRGTRAEALAILDSLRIRAAAG